MSRQSDKYVFVTEKKKKKKKERKKTSFVATNFLSRQNYVCRDKTRVCRNISFVSTSILLSRQKTYFVATKVCLSRHFCFCFCFVIVVVTSFFRDKAFVTTSIHLARQKTCFVATKDVFCRDKQVFVATKHLSRCRDKNDTCGSSRQ